MLMQYVTAVYVRNISIDLKMHIESIFIIKRFNLQHNNCLATATSLLIN